jgi:VWFA-related protein
MRAVSLVALVLVFAGCLLAGPAFAQQSSVPDAPAPQQAQSVPPSAPAPNAPAPQPSSSSLNNLTSQVAPGKASAAGDSQDQDQNQSPDNSGQAAPHQSTGTVPPTSDLTGPDDFQKTPPIMPKPGEVGPMPPAPPSTAAGAALPADNSVPTFHIPVTVVDVPVIVRNKHNQLVAGLPWWRFRVYEDGVRMPIWWFTTDAYPLSVAFVIDDTLPADIMDRVNTSLSAVANSLTPADSVAVVTYAGTGPELVTSFTGAAGPRLPAALEMAKKPGQEMGVPDPGGDDPLTAGLQINGQPPDPTLQPHPGGNWGILPHPAHPLNDAILFAARQLASQPRGRRRIIYVVSDGKNVRSKAGYKEVLEYLETNNISVYGTEVGDASLWGIGYLDRLKLPFLQPDNVLPRFALPTGGDVQAQLTENGIQNAFIHITESVRTAYTIDYISHQSTLANRFHNIEVRVEGIPGLTVDAKNGYYPSASEQQP